VKAPGPVRRWVDAAQTNAGSKVQETGSKRPNMHRARWFHTGFALPSLQLGCRGVRSWQVVVRIAPGVVGKVGGRRALESP